MKKKITSDHFKNYVYPCALQAAGASDAAFGLYSVDMEKDSYPYKALRYAQGQVKEESEEICGASWINYDAQGGCSYCVENDDGVSTVFTQVPGAEKTEVLAVNKSTSAGRDLGDGRWLLLCSDDLRQEGCSQEEIDKQSRYDCFVEYPFWYNGSGVVDRKRSRLYLWEKGRLTRISPEYMDVQHFVLAGSNVIMDGPEFKDIRRPRGKFCKYDLAAKTLTHLDDGHEYAVTSILELDKDHVVVLRSDQEEYGECQNEYVDIFNVNDGTFRRFNEDYEIYFCNAVLTDVVYGASCASYAIHDGGLYFISTVWDLCPILRFDLETGEVTNVVTDDFNVLEFALSNDHKTLYFMAEKGENGPELWAYDLATKAITQLTHYNDHLLEEYEHSPVETFTFHSTSGCDIEGFLMKPCGFEEGKKYKTILAIHGGPNVAYGGKCYYHELQYLASLGYVVMFCNPHGSVGRGIAFEDLRDKYYTCDLEDILSLYNYACEHFAFVDKDAVALSGGSYAGMMIDWIIGHYHMFKTAISDRGCANELEDFFMSDCGYEFSLEIRGGTIWEPGVFDKVWDRSPIKYADQCTTPTMFVHGEYDLRCTKEQSLSMYAALKLHGVKTKACIFKDEDHNLCWYGAPKNRALRLEVMRDWLAETL